MMIVDSMLFVTKPYYTQLQCGEEEAFNKDLKGSLETLQAKLKRYKRDCREYGKLANNFAISFHKG